MMVVGMHIVRFHEAAWDLDSAKGCSRVVIIFLAAICWQKISLMKFWKNFFRVQIKLSTKLAQASGANSQLLQTCRVRGFILAQDGQIHAHNSQMG